MFSVTLPPPHPAQEQVLLSKARFRVVRSGRRFGKTVVGKIAACLAAGRGMPVGWGSPSYKLLGDVWRDLVGTLRPVIRSISVQDHRLELKCGGSIECWSLDGPDPARGRKYGLFVIDEAGIAPNLRPAWTQAIQPTLTDLNGRALFLGTSKVEVPYFNELFALGKSGVEGWESFQFAILDNPHIDGQAAIDDARRAGTPEWVIQQEFYGQPVESDTGFFSQRAVAEHKALFAREPFCRGRFVVLGKERDYSLRTRESGKAEFTEDERGEWRLWFDPATYARGTRPVVIGADLGYGVGSSNSVLSVADGESGEKIAEFVSPGVIPEELGRIAAAAGLWFGGRRGAMIVPEVPGPGHSMVAVLRSLSWPLVWRDRDSAVEVAQGVEARFGWLATRESKRTLLSDYRQALASGRFQNHSEAALNECLTYREDERGRVVSEYEWGREESEDAARVPHGDRVIADALCWMGCKYAPRIKPSEMEAPYGSPMWRALEREKKARASSGRGW